MHTRIIVAYQSRRFNYQLLKAANVNAVQYQAEALNSADSPKSIHYVHATMNERANEMGNAAHS